MSDLVLRIDELHREFLKVQESLDLEKKKTQLAVLEEEAQNPVLWGDQGKAKKVMQDISNIQKEIEEAETLGRDIVSLIELSKEEGLELELEGEVGKAEKRLKQIKLKTYLSGKYDGKNALVSIHAGQGGTEAMDWASMLFRMYFRFVEKRGWKIDVIDEMPGEEAGMKNVVFRVEGPYSYGYLKGESGTHRLVRQSPFNADKLRQTSFALVEVLPEFGEGTGEEEIEIREDDLMWEFYRSSGHGGQNVNKVSTAVRLTHKPTGIVVNSQTQRYQEQNRKIALDILRSKLWAKEEEERAKEKQKVKGGYTPATWGTQIRSYVLHPYKMVKDLRTGVETSDTEGVLGGDINEFIEVELREL